MRAATVGAILSLALYGQPSPDPAELLKQAERLVNLYNWYDAHPHFQQAERLFKERGDERNALFARASRIRGEMQVRPWPELLDELDEVLASASAKQDAGLRLRTHIVRGDINLEMDVPAAKADWEAALIAARQAGDRRWESRAQGELGMIAFMLGDSGTARAQVGQALAMAMATGDVGAEARYLTSIAVGLHFYEEHDQAVQYFDRAIQAAAKHPEMGFQYVSCWGKSKALLAMGRSDEAARMIDEALRRSVTEDRKVKQAEFLLASADVWRKKGNADEALRAIEEALPIAEKYGFRILLAEAHFDLADLYRERGDVKRAAAHAAAGVELREKIGDRFLLPNRLLGLANLRWDEGARTEALDTLARATDIVEGLLANVPTADQASTLMKAMSNIYVRHFELAVANGQPVNYLFDVLERARGRILTDLVSGGPVSSRPRSEAYGAMQKELSRLQRSMLTARTAKQREGILPQIWETEQRMHAEDMPSQKWAGPRIHPVELAELKKALRPDELFVEYVVTADRVYAIVVSSESARVQALGLRADAEALAGKLVGSLGEGSESKPAAAALFAKLVTPLKVPSSKKSVVIVPDAALQGVPFDMLIAPSGKRLGELAVTSYAPSATAISRALIANVDGDGLPLLAIGDIPYGSTTRPVPTATRSMSPFDARSAPKLQPLPGSRVEVERAIVAAGPGSIALLGEQATETALKKEPLQRFEILHFAVHAFADARNPQRAALMLARDEKSDEDGFLQPREITMLPLKSKLVILSACSTGVGKSLGQEGIANLARAFLIAGSASVLTTSWEVRDTGSAALVGELYSNLRRGQDIATALRNAKVTLLQRFGPALVPTIAAFQIFGNGRAKVTFGTHKGGTK